MKEFFRNFNELKISWQIYGLLLIYVIIMIVALISDWRLGFFLFILLILIVFTIALNFNEVTKDISTLTNKLSENISTVQQDALFRSPIAALIYDSNLRIRWVNPAMQNLFGKKDILGELMLEVDDHFKDVIAVPSDRKWHALQFRDRHLKVMHQKELNSFYFIDVTKEYEIIENRKYDRLVFGYLLLEEYDEVVQSMDDQQSTTFDAEILRYLTNWTNSRNIYLKRLSEEKFLLIMNQNTLEELEIDKFKYIDQLREKTFVNNVPLTVSIGIAYSLKSTYKVDELAKQAQLNLDLALGRGGDQIVIKADDQRARFYGGNTNPSEKRTNVKSKLVYQALLNLIQASDQVLIAGHKTPDMDSMGSAIGLHRLVTQLKKPAKIIINPKELNQDIKQLLQLNYFSSEFKNNFIDINAAKKLVNSNSLIVMVDHHRPRLSEAEEILYNHKIVIIDHHRRGEDMPAQTELTYIEPYASSTSELITEFYINLRNTNQTMNRYEATALLAGIIVDTNNFSSRAGSKTFDVASYLKARGADTTQIHRFMKEDFGDIVARNNLFAKAEYLGEGYSVSRGTNEEVIDNVTAAQTADMMLDVENVEASFVIYRRSEDTIGISARSLGEVNVQTVMERLGGGGHLTNAATQIKEKTIDEAFEMLKTALLIQKENTNL